MGKEINETTEKKYVQTVLDDYRLAVVSREASLLGRKEVLTGKAKFGIFGDGKEVAQIALAKAFQKGDFRSGYYRDQTWMMALGIITVQQFFAQLYAHADFSADPMSSGRQMNCHFATPFIDQQGEWLDLKNRYNSAADISSTASQMPRAVGLALASKLYRNSEVLQPKNIFSDNGNEVCFASIGDASTSEGHFWETINAAGVLKIPLAVSVWDDGYGISVPKKYQTTKENISEVLKGFSLDKEGNGLLMKTAKGWDYAGLIEMYEKGIHQVREKHIPALFHITEVTQPQGHSTSGSHERYKSKERLQWENEFDCIRKMREWMIDTAIATPEQLDAIEKEAKEHVKESKQKAWSAYSKPIKSETNVLISILEKLPKEAAVADTIQQAKELYHPTYKDALKLAKQVLRTSPAGKEELVQWANEAAKKAHNRYNTHTYSQTPYAATHVQEVPAKYSDSSKWINGYEVLNIAFDKILQKDPRVVAFGEDVGKIGDVNQGFSGLQEKHGEHRIFDTGIRELTIMGQAIGMAMRGLRPIAEIQYLDYLIYGLQPLVDDVATLTYRTNGVQRAPVIIRTRGHRLEGIWHTGSPIGMIIHSCRGINVLVPRNMVQAAGMYHTLLASDEPAILIECLNGYRLKEQLPDNIGSFTVPLGKPDILLEGSDVTLVTYGSCVRIAQQAIDQLRALDISVELIDVQTLLPFDVHHTIVESLKKTNRIVFLDEDVPGGASAYMMQEVLEKQKGYQYLDSAPVTIAAKEHRSAYGSDGDYFSKPNADNVFEAVYAMMHEFDPQAFPELY